MRVAVASVQVPFVRGGAEVLAEGLRDALREAGHEAEIVTLPFQWYPPERVLDHMLAWRLVDLTESSGEPIDRVICLKFPAYLVEHPVKVVWLLHQHRTAYELWDHPLSELAAHPRGVHVREAIRAADVRHLADAHALFTLSSNVSGRLRTFCGLSSTPLYHPPAGAEAFRCAGTDGTFFFPSRVTAMKRQELVLQALARTRHPVRVTFAGAADTPAYGAACVELARRLRVADRVTWAGVVSEERKRDLFAEARGVVFPPFDEDYGYVTLEAMLSSKPVVTCSDSGAPLEFVRDGETGLVAEPNAVALAAALDELWADPRRAARLGRAGRELYEKLDISWPAVVERLLR